MGLRIVTITLILLVSLGTGLYLIPPQPDNIQSPGVAPVATPTDPGSVDRNANDQNSGKDNTGDKANAGDAGQRYYSDKVAILLFHHLDETESAATITPARFAQHLDTLTDLGYNFISLERAVKFLDGQGDVPKNAVAITFDDGYESFYHYAYPILKERNIPAAMFVIVGRVGKQEGEIPKLSWQQMRKMQRQGYSFYSHTYDSHRYIAVNSEGNKRPALVAAVYRAVYGGETLAEYRARVTQDLRLSKKLIEENLKQPVQFLAPPYGAINGTGIDIAKEVGYKYILTVKEGLNEQGVSNFGLLRINGGSPKLDGDAIHQEIQSYLKK